MSITREEVEHVAKLARLELAPHELDAFRVELNALLGHFEDIQSLDVSGIDPQPHAVSMYNAWAEDVAQATLTRDAALSNAPKTRAGLFVVPAILED
jgi:aspartyl-tRNA(Asn)/glutamyl-tRNA(Gln) amidotransferase subunit C